MKGIVMPRNTARASQRSGASREGRLRGEGERGLEVLVGSLVERAGRDLLEWKEEVSSSSKRSVVMRVYLLNICKSSLTGDGAMLWAAECEGADVCHNTEKCCYTHHARKGV